jgi:hypothetical protein
MLLLLLLLLLLLPLLPAVDLSHCQAERRGAGQGQGAAGSSWRTPEEQAGSAGKAGGEL